jgi:hypothetical protein
MEPGFFAGSSPPRLSFTPDDVENSSHDRHSRRGKRHFNRAFHPRSRAIHPSFIARDWLVGYYYAHIETFAVNASYAQDDWVRFGNGPQTNGTDIKGHEFRAAYAFTKNLNLMARLFLVEAIKMRQDGKRFRLDLNWKI